MGSKPYCTDGLRPPRRFRSGARPPHDVIIRFIDIFVERSRVEPACWVPRSRPRSARPLRVDLLVGEVARLHAEHYGVYAVRKMHARLRRQGWRVSRDLTTRLLRIAGLRTAMIPQSVSPSEPILP